MRGRGTSRLRRGTERSRTDRGQAYTLEGFVGAIIVLTAVLFAMQSIVITPTTGGAVDRTVQAQLQQEVEDALTVAENDGELSSVVRYWNHTTGEYHRFDVHPQQRGNYTYERFANATVMSDTPGEFEFTFGTVLDERFKQSGRSYNVEVTYQRPTGSDTANTTDSFYLVYQGRPSPTAFTESHTVALFDNQRLTAAGSDDTTLATADDYPIPNVDEDRELYNVVEVRVIVW